LHCKKSTVRMAFQFILHYCQENVYVKTCYIYIYIYICHLAL